MVAVPLVHGHRTAACYEDDFARDPRLDALRAKMTVTEEPHFTTDYYDPEKRAIGNSVQVFFNDGSATPAVAVEYPIGHRRRRAEGLPLLRDKFHGALAEHFPVPQAQAIRELFANPERLAATPVNQFLDRLALNP